MLQNLCFHPDTDGFRKGPSLASFTTVDFYFKVDTLSGITKVFRLLRAPAWTFFGSVPKAPRMDWGQSPLNDSMLGHQQLQGFSHCR